MDSTHWPLCRTGRSWHGQFVGGGPRPWPGSVGPEEVDEDEEGDGGNDDGHSGGPQRCHGETQRPNAHFRAEFVWKIKMTKDNVEKDK